MARKGMETSIVIIVAAIVILITALVVVTIFGGGMQNFLGVLNPWGATTSGTAVCQGYCQQLCLTSTGTDEPAGYNDQTVNGEGCRTFFQCKCSDYKVGFNCATYKTEVACKAAGCTTFTNGVCS